MNTGVMLYQNDVERALQYDQIKEVDILFGVMKPNEMRMVEFFAKFSASAMFHLETVTPDLLVDMAKQASLVLNSNRVYLRVERPNDSLSVRALNDFINLLVIETSVTLYLAAPASHFLRKDSLAAMGLELGNKLGMPTVPLFLLSNSIESLAVFDNKQFLALLRQHERAEFGFQFLGDTGAPVSSMKTVDAWNRKVWIRGIDGYVWNFLRAKEEELKKLPAGVIGIARAREDRTSVFSDKLCRGVAGKVNKGQIVHVADYLDEKIAITIENMYIRRNQFDIEKL